jgi:hypothetical protein
MEKNKCCLSINPLYDKELSVKIKRYQKNNIFIQTKIINCNVLDINYNEYNINSHKICNLIVLNTEKYIKSIGIFEFPLIAIKYKSGMNPQYNIEWKLNNEINRLYIYFDNNTYIFERNYKDNFLSEEQMITTNTFLLTNLISFFIGKFLEKTLHIQ